MTTREYIEDTKDSMIDEVRERWGIQRGSDGKEFIYLSLPTDEDIISQVDYLLEDSVEPLEDELPREEDEKLSEECRQAVLQEFYRIKEIRKNFIESSDELKDFPLE